jgi:hypothetical protein
MANSTKESGHAVNANNVIEKINVINRHQTEYNPSNPAIKLPSLLLTSKDVKAAVDKVASAKTAFTNATTSRKQSYVKMSKMVQQVIHLLKSSEATPEQILQGNALYSKFKSERIKDLPDEEELKATAAAKGETAELPKNISVSQQGFINRLAHFRDIILFLKTVTGYNPNEAELKIEALEAFADSVEALNGEKSKAVDEWSKAIKGRNNVMYKEPDGAYHLAVKIMNYVAGSQLKDSGFYKELMKYPVRSFK